MPDPKIEPWMVAAAEHIHKLRMGSLEVQFKMGLGATHPNLSNTEQSQMAQQLTIDAIARVLATHAPGPAKVPSRQPEWIEQIRRENRERIEQDFEGKLSEAEGPLMQVIDELLTHIDFTTDPASVPIGPGDVVQFHNNIMGWCTCTVTGITKDGRLQVNYSNSWTYPAESATRIGRAVYWPDGSKVEEGK